ncbi:unnamed protein product [Sphenostylis stenocarpa]|uniref:Uncharacterized protein n=1 Tax=Sphenostylis stenocarpa TaxID=92480 RepID=A0AA86SIH0_9FABA|nr:unnamed protein product [Sphenostylis stenocarpa]
MEPKELSLSNNTYKVDLYRRKHETGKKETADSNWTVRKRKRGKKLTENSGFAGIVEAENEDSSFLVTEERGKQFGKH